MDTPHLPRAIFGEDFENVYEPAEDTYLLLDALEKDLGLLKSNVSICLECGSGSGTVITALSKSLQERREDDSTTHRSVMIATDINGDACLTTKKCSKYHKQPNIHVVRTNLAESLVDRLENKVDLLVFNPPYVPTEAEELETSSHTAISRSWAGGASGRRVINEFLDKFVPRLLSKPHGVAYLVALDTNNIDQLLNYFPPECNIKGSVVMERRAGIELLYVIKFEWRDCSSVNK